MVLFDLEFLLLVGAAGPVGVLVADVPFDMLNRHLRDGMPCPVEVFEDRLRLSHIGTHMVEVARGIRPRRSYCASDHKPRPMPTGEEADRLDAAVVRDPDDVTARRAFGDLLKRHGVIVAGFYVAATELAENARLHGCTIRDLLADWR